MTKIEEIERQIQDHEKRISQLEKIVTATKAKPERKGEFKGLSGGIAYLISEKFLNSPKTVREVQEELKKEGYHYSYESIDKLLRVDFMAKRKMLTRVKENNIWRYVIRK